MSTYSSHIIHSDEKRHKCHLCGSVRYESYMEKLDYKNVRACAQFGNDLKCWACKNCLRKQKMA